MVRRRLVLTGAVVAGAAAVAIALLVLRTPEPPPSTPIPSPATTARVLTVPDVGGLSEEEAEAALTEMGLDTASQTEASDSVDAGDVIRTDPEAGSSVEEGTRVVVFVSTGP